MTTINNDNSINNTSYVHAFDINHDNASHPNNNNNNNKNNNNDINTITIANGNRQ